MNSPSGTRSRRLGGWGFEGESVPASAQLRQWLEREIGSALHPTLGLAAPPGVAPRPLPDLPGVISTDPRDRLFHSRGQALPDVIRLRAGCGITLPDAVCRPASPANVEQLLALCTAAGVRVIPWGGGTSVTGGVNVLPSDTPTLSLDLAALSGLRQLDAESGLATFGAGTTGPAVEAALAAHGFTLGHFPQSWELSTVGGWVATRSSGQESLGYGRIEGMVAGLEVAAPAGRLRLPVLPASAAGPDLRQLVMGSEGRLGVITEATLRVRPRPQTTAVEAALFPGLEQGAAAARELLTRGLPLTMLRLSDAPETEVAMAVGMASASAPRLVRIYLKARGIGRTACLMLYAAAGDPETVDDILRCARGALRRHRGVSLGRGPGRHWQRDRFRLPYLRESLLDLGYATDTLETAVPWSAVLATHARLGQVIAGALTADNERVAVLCHLSHPYRDGASLYFTFFFRCAAEAEASIARWATVKRAATTALVARGATLSHHHGVGQWHAPWYEAEAGRHGKALVEAAARHMDPTRILNPHVLLDAEDRLEA